MRLIPGCDYLHEQTTMSVKSMERQRRSTPNWLTIGLLCILAPGCRQGVRETHVPVAVPEAFSSTGSEPLPNKWWHAFGDEQLNALIDRALTDNFSLLVAWDRLAQAQAVARATDARLWPEVDLTAAASRSRRELGDETTYSSLYSAGVAASYEVDLWSRLRSSKRAAWLDVQAQRDAVDTAAITVAASIANTWFELREAKALVRISQQQVEINEQVLDIVIVQFRKGMASAADVLRQQQLIAATQAQETSARETVELLQYMLSVLIGKRPELAWQQTSIDASELPPAPAMGIPVDVLWRRPDVRRAYRQVQSADQRLASAVADQYPRLSLSAGVETSSVSVHDLFDDWVANLAANATQPLFDRARRRSEVKRQEAIVSEAIHAWGQTILEALREVETALTQERQQTELLENLTRQLELAGQTYERNKDRFVKAQTDYIRVLESSQSLQGLERELVRARRILFGRRVDLCRAIAGGWELTQPALAAMTNVSESQTAGASSEGDTANK
jgi:NodT family efflux transporter outer membrane factor (OMF) lipoprotein